MKMYEWHEWIKRERENETENIQICDVEWRRRKKKKKDERQRGHKGDAPDRMKIVEMEFKSMLKRSNVEMKTCVSFNRISWLA